MRRALTILAVSWLLPMPSGAWAGETNTAVEEFITGATPAELRSLAEQIVNHLSNANTDHDPQNYFDDGPLLSYSLVIDVDNPDPIWTAQALLANGHAFQFDFESGLQEWNLHGSAQRVQTQVLGGQWAVFGDGLAEGMASMSIELDLTDVASITMDMSFLGDPANFVTSILLMEVDGRGGTHRPRGFRADPTANPTTLAFDVGDILGASEITLAWAELLLCPGGCAVHDDSLLALVDNITLVPIPEPATLLLVLGGLGMGAAVGRRRRS